VKHRYLFILYIFICTKISAITFTNSNLPIVIITTDQNPNTSTPYEIEDELRVPATMKIIFHSDGNRNYVVDQDNFACLNYNGKIDIEIRGSSSQKFEKKPYGLTTYKDDQINNNVSILGMPKEHDWILNALTYDASFIRDDLSYELYSDMGNYSPHRKYCEVVVNGDYKGLYLFMEKLKADDNRINISKMTNLDNNYPTITGGYITKSDKTTGGDVIAWSDWGADFTHDYPNPENVTSQQNNYIYSIFSCLSTRAANHNESVTTGYPDIIDVPSFIDFMILCELSSNVDSYQLSTYYHKDRKGKLRAGPIWDFNLTYGLDIYGNRSRTNVWQFNDGDLEGPKFWKDLFNSTLYKRYLSKRWFELTDDGQPLNYDVICNKIDSIVSIITEASYREQLRWKNSGNLTPNISYIKKWLSERIGWLNSQLNSYNICTDSLIPKLVISKINYHPSDAINEDSLEFIEITNNSNKVIDLTGIYFRELGVTYRFPNNSTLHPNKKIYLASDINMFKSFYELTAFGQFDRHLSNKS